MNKISNKLWSQNITLKTRWVETVTTLTLLKTVISGKLQAHDMSGDAMKEKVLKVIITNGALLDEAIQIPDAFDSEISEKHSLSERLAINDSPGG